MNSCKCPGAFCNLDCMRDVRSMYKQIKGFRLFCKATVVYIESEVDFVLK